VKPGERLGFPAGHAAAKNRSVHAARCTTALYDMAGRGQTGAFSGRRHHQVAPWRLCGGERLNDSFVILDEAQNTTSEQMKMFLRRLGFNSKAVITGEIRQIDLPTGRSPGWWRPLEICGRIPGISVVQFGGKGCGAAQPGAADHPGVRGI